MPKLVAEDIPLLHSLLSDVFPGVKYTRAGMKELRAEIAKVCAEMHLVYGETGSQWVDKVSLEVMGKGGRGREGSWGEEERLGTCKVEVVGCVVWK